MSFCLFFNDNKLKVVFNVSYLIFYLKFDGFNPKGLKLVSLICIHFNIYTFLPLTFKYLYIDVTSF